MLVFEEKALDTRSEYTSANKAKSQGDLNVAANPPRWNTQTLFAGQSLIEIVHRGDVYRLQITRQGKLILTK